MRPTRSSSLRLSVSLSLLLAFAVATLPAATPTTFPDAAQPQLTVGTDGRIWLVYGRAITAPPAPTPVAHADGQKHKGHQPPTRSGDVFVACSTDGGATFAPAVKVAHVPQLMLGMRRGPRLAAHGDRLTVTVIAHELLAFTSTDGGKSWAEPVTINTVPTSAREGLHDLAGSTDGEAFVTWLDLRNGKTELWGSSSRDGGRTWSPNEQVYKSPDKTICECCHPTTLFDAQGNLAVMWRNAIEGSRDMWLSLRPRGATQFTAARKLGTGTWTLNACPMDGGRIVALGEGKFGAVWQRAGEVFLTGTDGAETLLGKGKQPVAVARDGQTFVFWQQGADLVSARDLRGTAPTKYAGDARFPSLVALPSGQGAVIACEVGPAKGPTTVTVERL